MHSEKPEPDPSADPDISLVVPAWNEEAYLDRALDTADVARARYRGGVDRIEVIVADNASTDRTSEIARDRGCRLVHVRKRCIAAARNGGAAVARGKIVCFADADFRIHPETFNYIGDVMGRGRFVGGVTGLAMERWSFGIAATWYLIMPPFWLVGLDGGVWFCLRRDFWQVGGFNENVRAGEDVLFVRALQVLGAHRHPTQRLATRFTARALGARPPLAVASCRKFDRRGDWHAIREMFRGLFLLVFSRRKLDALIDRVWYKDRSRP